MKQLRYTLLIMLVALVLLPTGVGAAETQKDLKIQDVFCLLYTSPSPRDCD